jgi:hypothetical protein
MQRFYASPSDTFTSANGAIGHRPGGAFDCLGPYAIVRNCPIEGTDLRLTCYAQGYADTHFSIPAATRYRGQRIKGYFTTREDGVVFCPMDSSKHLLPNEDNTRVYEVEETDTFGGEANYCWVRRYSVRVHLDTSRAQRIRAIKAALGWTGERCHVSDYGDLIDIRPVGRPVVAFAS